MEETRSLLRKADATLSDLITDGGYLQPAQAQQFIRTMIIQPKLSKEITVTPLDAPNQLIEKVRFAGRVLQPGTPGVALNEAQRSKPNFGKVQWSAKMFKAEVRLVNAVLEQSIERGNLKNTIMQTLSEAVGRDAEIALIQGDVLSADPFLAQMDGILKKATSNIVNANNARLTNDILDAMLRKLPKEFMAETAMMKYMTSVNAQLDYNKWLSSRGTGYGDRVLEEGGVPKFYKIPVDDYPLFPVTGFSGSDQTNVILTHPKNINYGIWKQIRIAMGEDVSAGCLIMVVELWIDVVYVEETAVVKAYNLLNS